jgi:WD40 repeat protein
VTVTGDNVISVGWDDTARTSPLEAPTITTSFPLNGQPVAAATAAGGDVSAVVTLNAIHLFRGAELVGELSGLAYTPSAVAVLRDEEVAVGATDNKIYIYAIQGNTLSQTAVVTGHLGPVTALSYSPSGELLGAGDSTRAVNVWERGSWAARVQGTWVYHTTRVNVLAWSPSGQYLASGSVDEQIIVWNLETPRQKGLTLSFAHKEGVTGLAFLDEERLVSAGNDHCVCIWNLAAGERK